MIDGKDVDLHFFSPYRKNKRLSLSRSTSQNSRHNKQLSYISSAYNYMMRLIWSSEGILKQDTDHLRNAIRKNVGNYTFQEAFDKYAFIKLYYYYYCCCCCCCLDVVVVLGRNMINYIPFLFIVYSI